MSVYPSTWRKKKSWLRRKMASAHSFTSTNPTAPHHPPSKKRSRAADDVDGVNVLDDSNDTNNGNNTNSQAKSATPGLHSKKKRRLRFYFITSRLSSPFSEPSSHIIGRSAHKLASWIRKAIRAIRPPPPLVQVALLNNARIQAAVSLSQAQMLSREQLREVLENRRCAKRPGLPALQGAAEVRGDPVGDQSPGPGVTNGQATSVTYEEAQEHDATAGSSLFSSAPRPSSLKYDIFDDEAGATAGERESGWESANATLDAYSDYSVFHSSPAISGQDPGPFPETYLPDLKYMHDQHFLETT